LRQESWGLELIHRADAGARQALLNLEDLRGVGRDNDNVVELDALFFAFAGHCHIWQEEAPSPHFAALLSH
jgi:hypothetical protein